MKNEFVITDISVNELRSILKPNDTVEIYTDGSCKGNPGPGGWGAILIFKNNRVTISGNDNKTTNNRMELIATIRAIELIPANVRIVIYTDSTYVKNGVTTWLQSWKINNWKTKDNKPVKNIDLWLELENVIQHKNISWNWVKGHSECVNNNNADFIAKSAINNDIEGFRINNDFKTNE